MRTNIGAKALAVFMVAVMVLSTVLVFNNSSGESGDPVVPLAEPQSPISVEVVYHPYEPGKAPNVTDVPTNYKSIFGYNTTVGLDGTTVSVTCHGGVISTEGNPQTWSHTQWFKPITEDQFGTHDLYVAHMTHVFTGWKYKKDGGSIKNQIYNPGEVFEYKEDGFWYAKNVTSPGSSDSKLDTTDGKIHVYATWATVEQVLENGESVDLLNYILFGNSRFDYTGSTLPKRLSSAFVTKSGSSYVDASTRDIASDKDSFGRSFVRNVYEKLNLEGDSSTGYKMKLWGEYHNVRTDSVVVDSDVDIYYDESTRNLYVDGYNCTYLESGNTIYLCFYYKANTDEMTVNILGKTYHYEYQNPSDPSSNKIWLYVDGQQIDTSLDTSLYSTTGNKYVGYSRFYAYVGTTNTNIRVVDGTIDSNAVDANGDTVDLFTKCTIVGKDSNSCVNLRGDSYVGTGGCVIDSIKLTGDAGSALHSNGNLLVIGSHVTSVEGSEPSIGGGSNSNAGSKPAVVVNGGVFKNVASSTISTTDVVIIHDANVTGSVSVGRATGTSYLYVIGSSPQGVVIDSINPSVTKTGGTASITVSGVVSVSSITGSPVTRSGYYFDIRLYGSYASESISVGSISRVRNLTIEGCDVELGGNGIEYALDDLTTGSLTLKSVSSTAGGVLTLNSPLRNVNAYNSMGTGSDSAATTPNEIILGKGNTLSFDRDGTYKMVTGYTVISAADEGGAFTGYVLGDKDSTGGFVTPSGAELTKHTSNTPSYACWCVDRVVVIVADSVINPESASDYQKYTILGLSEEEAGKVAIAWTGTINQDPGAYYNSFTFSYEYMPDKTLNGDSSFGGGSGFVGLGLTIYAYSGIVTVTGTGYSSVVVSVEQS